MLLVTFQIGGERYALDCRNVVEIIPMVRLEVFHNLPDYIRGVFQYRGKLVPVVDLCSVSGFAAAREMLSTRIILVNYRDGANRPRVIGLIAELVTETMRVDEASLRPLELELAASALLGEMVMTSGGMVQCIRPEALLPPSVGRVLFSVEKV